MRRLNPKDVADRFVELGLKPGAGWWRGEDRNGEPDQHCACGIGVMLPDNVSTNRLSPFDAARVLGLTEMYVLGFVEGFDYASMTLMGTLSDDFVHGFNDGIAAYRAAEDAVENERLLIEKIIRGKKP